MENKVTAFDICKALQAKYTEPDWYLGFEVGNGCGSYATRHADAIAINQYPSRGHEVRGFEIKVSKQDLKRELDEPAKAEAFEKYCNYWFLVVPKGLTDGMQIPEPWGIIEYSDGNLRQKKKAEYSKSEVDKGFLCAFIRGRNRCDEARNAMWNEERMEELKQRVSANIRYKLEEAEKIQKRIEKFKKETGIDLGSYEFDWRGKEALKLAFRFLNTDDKWMRIKAENFSKDLAEVTDWISSTVAELKKFVDIVNGEKK